MSVARRSFRSDLDLILAAGENWQRRKLKPRWPLPDVLGAALPFCAQSSHALHDAQDLTQSFFDHLIEHKIYTCADRQKGKFRFFFVASLPDFLTNAYDREQTWRGGV